jgi:multiple sugar transport system substrate-binding protein
MKIRFLAAGATAVVLAAALAGCSSPDSTSSDSGSSGGDLKGTTITYWATNQGASLDADKQILTPELAKFTKQTGVKVDLQVVDWANMTQNTLQATISGQGPDVVNIGNTNATTFNSTGAFLPFDGDALKAIGGKDKFLPSAWGTAGPEGKEPTSVPLYSQVYALFYNKKLFSDAGLQPPKTWEDLVSDAKKLTDSSAGTWGITMPAGTVNVAMHMQYIFTAQNGGSPFKKDGTPDFTTSANVDGVKQYVSLMSDDHVMNPSDAQFTDGTQATSDFAKGKAGMYLAQTGAVASLQTNGMDPSQYGVVPIPSPDGGKKVGSFIAGTNVSIFKNTKHKDAALALVKFLTSPDEQKILNKEYGTLPPVKDVPAEAYAQYPDLAKAWSDILANYAVPLSLVPTVSAYQANVGAGVVGLFGKAATGASISDSDIKQMLTTAQQKMGTN